MTTFLGLIELLAWILAVLAIAAGVTYSVVKVFPGRQDKPKPEDANPAG